MFSKTETMFKRLGSDSEIATITALAITSVALGAYLSLGVLTPVYSDGALFADVVREIAGTGQVLEAHPHVLADRDLPFPIFYPQGAFVGFAAMSLFLGEFALDLVSALAGAFTILGMYLFSRHALGSRWYALLVPAAIAGSFYLMLFSGSRFKTDIVLAFLFVAFLYAATKTVTSKSLAWPMCGALFLAGAIGAKQQGTFFLLLFLLGAIPWLASHRETRKSGALGRVVMLVSFGVLLASPVLWHQFATTGTIAYPNNYIEPFSTWEAGFANLLGIQRWNPNPTFSEYVGGSDFGRLRIQESTSLAGLISFLNPLDSGWGGVTDGLFLLLAISGAIEAARQRTFASASYLILLGLLVLSYVTLIPVREDISLLPVLATPLLAFGLRGLVRLAGLFQHHSGRITLLVLVILLVAASAASSVGSYQHFHKMSSLQSWRAGEFVKVGEWLDGNAPTSAIILTSRVSEVGYYANRETIWLNLLDASDLYLSFSFGNETEVIAALRAFNVSYVLVPVWWIGRPDAWIGYMSARTVKMMGNSAAFIVAYKSEGILLFELRPTSPYAVLVEGFR